MAERCFHCHEPVPPGLNLAVRYQGQDQPMCCPGCQAVASLIIESGQAGYYRFRQQPAAPVDTDLLARIEDWKAFDETAQPTVEGLERADVVIEGMRCAACAWLIERRLGAVDGVASVVVDPVDHGLTVQWDPQHCSLGHLLSELTRIGFRPHPGTADARRQVGDRERRGALKRLGIAGLGMMQVMMVAGGTWFAAPGTIDPDIHRFLDLVAMLVATPVVLVAGAPFFTGAVRALAAGRVNIDVPVALALLLAYGASCRNLLAGTGTVYFDSVTMFVFFLLLGRYVEMVVRQRALSSGDAVARLLPDTAIRVSSGGDVAVPRDSLAAGDVVRVRQGDALPADGSITEGNGEIDESLLTGEARPVRRQPGDSVLAGSINRGAPLLVEVRAVGEALRLSRLQRQLAMARGHRPLVVQQADRVARYVVAAVLLIAVVAWGLWLPHDTDKAFQVLLAVLVVTCPCALSLATPSALAAASLALGRRGLLVFGGSAIDALAGVDHVVFDKTGTLTRGRPTVRVDWLTDGADRDQVLSTCAALERGSSHPIARALAGFDQGEATTAVSMTPGAGVRGRVSGSDVVAGHRAFVTVEGMASWPGLDDPPGTMGRIFVARDGQPWAVLGFEDRLRQDARSTVAQLKRQGLEVSLLSGDQAPQVAAVATACQIDHWVAALNPEDKLAVVRSLQARGRRVLAVGDGVNDAPVLAGADASVAIGEGADLAHSGADLLLTDQDLSPLLEGRSMAHATQRIIRQNLAWALIYNGAAVPLAAMGWVTPWMAALGMSISSLVVVLNAARLGRPEQQPSQREELPA